MEPRVTLLSWTNNPIGTIYSLWKSSRDNLSVIHPNEVDLNDPEVLEIFHKVFNSKIPVTENISFVFLLEGVSISFREQMVRHRIGVKVGDRLGVDLVPDLAESTWWSQTMRVLDMSNFANERHYRTPRSLEGKKMEGFQPGLTAKQLFDSHMHVAQETYRRLLAAGVPAEDAREVLPMATGHRVSWTLNLTALQHVIGKRCCWIAQSELWHPIIKGMIDELAGKVHPYFRNLANPPCFKNGESKGCDFGIENDRRMSGEDPIPPCPLYVSCQKQEPYNLVRGGLEASDMLEKYESLWQRSPFTGNPL